MEPPVAPALVPARERPRPWRRSVFWKVAAILVGVQVATGLMAVALSAYLAYDRSRGLAANSIRLRLDGLAEEVEQRALLTPFGEIVLPPSLVTDLGARFPDPVTVLGIDGRALLTIVPDSGIFGAPPPRHQAPPPTDMVAALEAGEVVVEMAREGASWGLAPLYDADGLPVGGLLVQPLTRSIAREMAGTREAFASATRLVAALAGLIALVLGAVLTLSLVRPLRRITRQVEAVGAGDYRVRLPDDRDDELGRLASAVNRMAEAVAASIDTLRAADALRRELVANVGHDLRTPMAAMLGYVEEAERYLAAGDAPAAREALVVAGRQGQLLRRLIADLFELSLLDSPDPPLHVEPVPLGELLADAARAHRPLFQTAGIRFEAEIPRALPVLEADGMRLIRVLDNLLDNARRHTSEGGRVRLAATVEDTGVRVTVEDDGRGMTADEAARVFDRYYRGKDARTRHTEGTGLGLSISRAIARAHGGDLEVQSSPGEGSRFTLRLPVHDALSPDIREN